MRSKKKNVFLITLKLFRYLLLYLLAFFKTIDFYFILCSIHITAYDMFKR